MSNERLATITSYIGAGLLFATAGLHLSFYGSVTEQAPADGRPLLAALWVGCGISVMLTALLVIAVTPLQTIRRRAILLIAALTPLSMAVLQIVYLGFIPPTAILLLDAGVIIVAGQLGHARQPVPVPAA
jgi:CHASE2 domain-containing sensor protein